MDFQESDEELIHLFSAEADSDRTARLLHDYFDRRLAPVLSKRRLYIFGPKSQYLSYVWYKLKANACNFNNYGTPGAATAWLNQLMYTTIIDCLRQENPTVAIPGTGSQSGTARKIKAELQARYTYESDDYLELILDRVACKPNEFGFTSYKEQLHTIVYAALAEMAEEFPQLAKIIESRLEQIPHEDYAKEIGLPAASVRQLFVKAKKKFVNYLPDMREMLRDSDNDPDWGPVALH